MKNLSLLIIILGFLFSCKTQREGEDKLIVDRLEFIYETKSFINDSIWPDFVQKRFDVPLIYYTDSNCYVVNPKKQLLSQFEGKSIENSNKEIEMFKTRLIDDKPFHMSASILFGDSIVDYNYYSPYIKSSSVEITIRTIPDVKSTEEWLTMIIHEYFHGFQYQHKEFLNFLENNVLIISPDSLKTIYQSVDWFKKSVDAENETLLKALLTTDLTEITNQIDDFQRLRKNRRERTKAEFGFDIELVESGYETLEGTARYVEFNLYDKFKNKKPEASLLKSDPLYYSYEYFNNFSFEKNDWLFLSDKTTYFYATGFNIARLLDRLNIVYKSRLFNECQLTLEQILREYNNGR